MKRCTLYRSILLLTLGAVICFSPFAISYAAVGDSGAQSLKIGIGARAIGMGESFVALADDADAIYWNPGGLGQIEKKEISMMYNQWFEGIKQGYVGYVHPLGNIGTFGGAVSYLIVGDMDRTEIDSDGDDVSTSQTFGASDMFVTLSYGRKIKMLDVGVSLKYITEKIEDESAAAFAVDLGFLYATPVPKLNVGLSVQNLGTKIKFISESDLLPLNFKVGASYKMLEKDALALALDVNIPNEGNVNVHAGAEYLLFDMIALRAGYKTTTIEGLGVLSGLSAGCGFAFKGYGIDYAWVPYGDLGSTHRVSLAIKF